MLRLLIVDDEAPIVEWLRDLFEAVPEMELDIFTAYSGEDALKILDTCSMDVVLSDIQMPGMDGLRMLTEVRALQPRCRVVFLTAHGRFDYVYTALRNEGVDYVLKTEEDEVILSAVRRALLMKLPEDDSGSLDDAERMLVRQDALSGLIEADGNAEECLLALSELSFSLDLNLPVLPVLVWRAEEPAASMLNAQWMIKLDTLARQYFGRLNMESVLLDGGACVWLLQPREENWEWAGSFVTSALDAIEREASTRGINAVFALSPPVSREALPNVIASLRRQLRHGGSDARVITATSLAPHETYKALGSCLQNGWHDTYLSKLPAALLRLRDEVSPLSQMLTLLSQLAEYAAAHDLLGEPEQTERIEALALFGTGGEVEKFSDALLHFSTALFARIDEKRLRQADDAVERIAAYIQSHLGGDLSIIALAERASLNPSYLSRLFRRRMSMTLSEYILSARIEKAKQLLMETDLHSYEVGAAVGYFSATAFNRIFKRATRNTPQEYRALNRNIFFNR